MSVAMLLAICLSTAGLFYARDVSTQFFSDPNERMRELLNESESSGQIREDWRRFWMLDQPSHLTPVRIHGGVGP
jgi:hypothetical protein